MVTIKYALRANSWSSCVKKKREHNALKIDKAQSSFCCYSETRPALSPTHICKIINRCLKSLISVSVSQTRTLPQLYYSICSVTISGSLPLHFLNSIPSAHVLMHSGHKHMQMQREKNATLINSHMLTLVLTGLSQSKKTMITRNSNFSHVCVFC